MHTWAGCSSTPWPWRDLCLDCAKQYPQVDRDILCTAALLHDIGKCDELTFDTAIEYTDEGTAWSGTSFSACVVCTRRLARGRNRVRPEQADAARARNPVAPR